MSYNRNWRPHPYGHRSRAIVQPDGFGKSVVRYKEGERAEELRELGRELQTYDPLTIATALHLGERNPHP